MEAFLLAVAQALPSIASGITSNAAYDFLKSRFSGKAAIPEADFKGAISDFLSVHGVKASADTVMTLLAQRGVLQVTNSDLHANNSLEFGASGSGRFVVGHNSKTSTDRTAIHAGAGAFITGQNASVRQNPDGSISFHVGSGPGDGISFHTKK